MWRTARESVTELKKKRITNESNLDFMCSYSKRNLDSMFHALVSLEKFMLNQAAVFLNLAPNDGSKVNTYCFQGEAGPHTPLFFSPSQYLRLNDFNFPHRLSIFVFLFVKPARVLKYCIYSYSNKRSLIEFFYASSAAFIRGWHLFESWKRQRNVVFLF